MILAIAVLLMQPASLIENSPKQHQFDANSNPTWFAANSAVSAKSHDKDDDKSITAPAKDDKVAQKSAPTSSSTPNSAATSVFPTPVKNESPAQKKAIATEAGFPVPEKDDSAAQSAPGTATPAKLPAVVSVGAYLPEQLSDDSVGAPASFAPRAYSPARETGRMHFLAKKWFMLGEAEHRGASLFGGVHNPLMR